MPLRAMSTDLASSNRGSDARLQQKANNRPSPLIQTASEVAEGHFPHRISRVRLFRDSRIRNLHTYSSNITTDDSSDKRLTLWGFGEIQIKLIQVNHIFVVGATR